MLSIIITFHAGNYSSILFVLHRKRNKACNVDYVFFKKQVALVCWHKNTVYFPVHPNSFTQQNFLKLMIKTLHNLLTITGNKIQASLKSIRQ